MGFYIITIKGSGAHHNDDLKADADKMAFKFLHDLQFAGHKITEASFISSYQESNLLKIGGYLDYRNETPMFGQGEPTALTLKEVREIEEDKDFGKTHLSSWNNGNFRKLLDTVKVLYSEINKLKSIEK